MVYWWCHSNYQRECCHCSWWWLEEVLGLTPLQSYFNLPICKKATRSSRQKSWLWVMWRETLYGTESMVHFNVCNHHNSMNYEVILVWTLSVPIPQSRPISEPSIDCSCLDLAFFISTRNSSERPGWIYVTYVASAHGWRMIREKAAVKNLQATSNPRRSELKAIHCQEESNRQIESMEWILWLELSPS